jgi:phosphoribosylformimino-5-aminoimidazole carboxamide ribotide isomerase
MFELIPAIDIQGGRCVRLLQGDFAQATDYGDDPLAQALAWQAGGARRLHLVDLDGARTGVPVHLELARAIARKLDIPVQVGGGLRTTRDVERMLSAGVDRVALGTALLESPKTARACAARYPGRVIASLDERGGNVAVRGWLANTSTSALALARHLAASGLERTVYTDISRDGALTGPNLAALREMVQQSGLKVIASGGIRNVGDVLAVRASGAEAVIVGRALYTGDLRLGEALDALAEQEAAGAR